MCVCVCVLPTGMTHARGHVHRVFSCAIFVLFRLLHEPLEQLSAHFHPAEVVWSPTHGSLPHHCLAAVETFVRKAIPRLNQCVGIATI